MKMLLKPAVRDSAALIASEAFRLPRVEALKYLNGIDNAAADHHDGDDFRAATALVRRDLFAVSAP